MDSNSNSNFPNHNQDPIKQNGFFHPKLSSEPARSPSRAAAMASPANTDPKVVTGTAGYVLEDVPHLTDYFPNLPVRRRFHRSHILLGHRLKLLHHLISDHVDLFSSVSSNHSNALSYYITQ